MKNALALAAATAALALAGSASAATMIWDEDFSEVRTWPGWVLVSQDTTQATTGSSSILATTVGANEAYFRFVIRNEGQMAIPVTEFDPTMVTVSFKYKLEIAETFPLSVGFQWGYWGEVLVKGTANLVGDGQWHDATVNFSSGWVGGTVPSSTAQLTHLRFERDDNPNFWIQTTMTLHLDSVVYAVPEPTSLAVLGVCGILALRRKR